MPARSKDERWKSKFALFIEAYGAPLLARRLNVTRDSLYKWIAGSVHIRPARAMRIVALARRRKIVISLDEIYESFDEYHAVPSRKR